VLNLRLADNSSAALHLGNPRLVLSAAEAERVVQVDETQDGVIGDPTAITTTKRGTVRLWRFAAITVQFAALPSPLAASTATTPPVCPLQQVRLKAERAWCVQACLDLLDGVTVWDAGAGAAARAEAKRQGLVRDLK
jgi:hypothetical protein